MKAKCNGITHTCCNKRLEKEGGKARCCYCRPHKGCEFTKPKWEEKWKKKWLEKYGVWADKSDLRQGDFLKEVYAGKKNKNQVLINYYKEQLDFFLYAIQEQRREIEKEKIEDKTIEEIRDEAEKRLLEKHNLTSKKGDNNV